MSPDDRDNQPRYIIGTSCYSAMRSQLRPADRFHFPPTVTRNSGGFRVFRPSRLPTHTPRSP